MGASSQEVDLFPSEGSQTSVYLFAFHSIFLHFYTLVMFI